MRRTRPSNISVPHSAHDTSPVRHRLLRRTGSGRSTGSRDGAGGGGSDSATHSAGAGFGGASGGEAVSGVPSRSPTALATDLAELELGAEARKFVGSRLSSSSKDDDDEFELCVSVQGPRLLRSGRCPDVSSTLCSCRLLACVSAFAGRSARRSHQRQRWCLRRRNGSSTGRTRNLAVPAKSGKFWPRCVSRPPKRVPAPPRLRRRWPRRLPALTTRLRQAGGQPTR